MIQPATTDNEAPPAPLPSGWQELKDATSGRTYSHARAPPHPAVCFYSFLFFSNLNATNRYFVHAASSKTTYTRPGSRPGEGSALKRPPPLASLMGVGGAGSVKRRTEDDHSKVEIEYFSKEEEARAAACKGG